MGPSSTYKNKASVSGHYKNRLMTFPGWDGKSDILDWAVDRASESRQVQSSCRKKKEKKEEEEEEEKKCVSI